jgi:hypothetical protein
MKKSTPTIKQSVLQEFKLLPDTFRGLFKSKYRNRIEKNIYRLQCEWWDNHAKMDKLKKTLNPREYIPIEIKNDQIQKQIDLLKLLLNE